MKLKIESCTKDDFLEIVSEITDFWGSDRTLAVHHPMFIHEFGNTAYVIKQDGEVVAYLFGFLSQTSKTGYVHLIGVRQSHQNKGLGKALYLHFRNYLKGLGFNKIKAITTTGNKQSISFHKKIGMTLLGDPNEDGVPVVKNYSGIGQDRVVFEMEI